MPLPFIIGGLAAAAAIAGVGGGLHGAIKTAEASDVRRMAEAKQKAAVEKLEKKNKSTVELMDSLGSQELKILDSFNEFSDLIEKIQNRPEFIKYTKDGVDLGDFEIESLKEVAVGAETLLGGIGGAVAGTAGGFAAAGATTSAIMALGTASTGTAISSLSGVAATNATLAALGGGSLAAGGGGMALGTAVLGGATLGAGLLVGGIIFGIVGARVSDKADEAYHQAERAEKRADEIVNYLTELAYAAEHFKFSLTEIEDAYRKRLSTLDYIVNFSEKANWKDFSGKEKLLTENLILLVGVLYRMCKVNLVIKNDDEDGINKVNYREIHSGIEEANTILDKLENE